MSLFEGPGDLAEVPLAAVLLDALNQRATGVLTVEHEGGASRVFVRDGVPVGAQSFGEFRPLGQSLLAAGAIDVDALGQSLAEMARTGKQQGEVLVGMGAVTREQVDQALAEQQAAYLGEVASLASGRFSFDAAAPVPAWTRGIRVSPLKTIVDALEKPQASPLVVSALQPVAAGLVALAPGQNQLDAAFGWSAAESQLVRRLQRPATLDAFFAEPGVAPERARALLAALLLLGLASGQDAPPGAPETVPGVVVDLADLAGVPIEPEPPWPSQLSGPAQAATPEPAARPARRSDPEEARRRRQRLLLRAMQNMGVGPLSGNPPPNARKPTPAVETGSPGARLPATAAEDDLRRALEAALPQARSTDLFERLGVPRTATRVQVKAAYLQLAKQLHPDRFGSPALADVGREVKDLFAALNEAYEVLSDDRKRGDYLARHAPAPSPARPTVPEGAAVDFQKAEACARTRDLPRARAFYESALRAEAKPEYQAGYAWFLLQDPRGDRARARSLAEAALRDPACLDRAALVCAVLAREDGEDEKAERLLRRALQANPRNVEAERELRALEARREKPKPSGLSGLFRKR